MKDILSEIIAHKRIEIEQQKQAVSPGQLQEQAAAVMQEEAAAAGASGTAPVRSMKRALANSSSGIIAEFKRRSPSKGWIRENAQAETVPPAYEAAGAAALSILTDERFFGGTLRDIRTARPLVDIPILRKDFIIDRYQLLQARIVGADAVLLIAACLTPDECRTLTLQAHELGLEVLLEVHTPSELSYIYKETDMIGVNNRNLGSFVTDTANSLHMAGALKEAVAGTGFPVPPLLVSESGISCPATIRELRSAGFRGFLMGEAFMRTEQPGSTLKEFIHNLQEIETGL